MATTTRILDANVNGTVYTSNANAALEALDTCHSGATAPTDEVANGKLWLDTSTTPGILKVYNNAAWEVAGSRYRDNDKAIFGTGSDLQIYHDGANSYIADTATGSLHIKGTSLFLEDSDGNEFIRMSDQGAGGIVYLKNLGATKLTTTSTGIDVTGTVTADGLTVETASPTIILKDNDSTGTPASGLIKFNDSDNSTSAQIGFGSTSNSDFDIFQAENAAIDLWTNATQRMRITSSGNVGIGTAAPSSIITSAPRKGAKPTNGSSAIGLTLFNDQDAVTNDGVEVRFDHSFGTPAAQSRGAFVRSVATTGYAGAVSLAFGTSSGDTLSEKVRINSSGYVLVGTTSPLSFGTGTVQGVVLEPNALVASRANQAPLFLQRSGSDGRIVEFYRGSALVGGIVVNGSSTSYNTSSDYRLKENITPVQGASDIVKAMQPVTYTFKSDGSWHDGFLAHELQELHPRAVSGEKNAMKDEEYEVTPAVEATYDAEGVELTPAVPAVMGTRSVPDYQGVDYSKLTPILTAALQEALNKIDALEVRIAALEA